MSKLKTLKFLINGTVLVVSAALCVAAIVQFLGAVLALRAAHRWVDESGAKVEELRQRSEEMKATCQQYLLREGETYGE